MLFKKTITLKLSSIKKKKNIKLSGSQEKVNEVKKEIKLLMKKMVTKKFSFDDKYQVTKKDLLQLKKELEDSYDVNVSVNEGFVNITSLDNSNWKFIEEEIKKLRLEEVIWSPPNYDSLAKFIFFEKGIEINKFKEDWNLKNLFFERKQKVVKISARNIEDVNQAKQALEALLEQKKIISQAFKLDSYLVFHILTRNDRSFNQKYQSIQQEFRVSFISRKVENMNEIFIRGCQEDVNAALSELKQLVEDISSQLRTKDVEVSKALANEFSKENWKFAKEILRSYGVYLSLPEKEKNLVVAEISGNNGFKIQVVDGNLLHEQDSECIVNAANENLKHFGGIAAEIARKAGPKLVEESDAIIQRQGIVQKGTAVMTTAGKLQFKAVIHTVGPIWTDGMSGEIELLKKSLESVLKLANDQKFCSISIPAISAGIYGFPSDQCTNILMKTAIDYIVNSSPLSTLKLIRFCDTDKIVVSLLEYNMRNLSNNLNFTQVNQIKEPLEIGFQWSWKENNGEYIQFDPDQNYQIEVAYVKQNHKGKILVTGDLQKSKNNHQYEIDFDAMTEINTTFKLNPRKIKRDPRVLDQFKWEVQTNKGWEPFESVASKQIELGYQRKISFISIEWYGINAQVSFDQQVLISEKGRYPVRRKERNYEDELLLGLEPDDVKENLTTVTSSPKKTKLILSGLNSDLENGWKKLNDKIKEMTISISIKHERKISPDDLKEIEAIAALHGGEITYNENSGIVITAIEPIIAQTKADITEYLLNKIPSGQVTYPQYWEPQTNSCEVKPLQKNSKEWNEIEEQMKKTVPNINLIKIERIQNKRIWEKYAYAKAILENKNNGNANEKRLFHGTRKTSPSTVYSDENGFDMRYCNSGLWGIAIYFAVNASYSVNYASTTPEGYKQMFMPRVLVGDSVKSKQDDSLRKPPQKESSDGITIFYDAVCGETAGSVVYMIYDFGRAYPDYLITYTLEESM